MTPDSSGELVGRIRALLRDEQVREISMFGVIAFMVDDTMAVGAHRDGSLLVRVSRAEDARLLESPGASRAEMGAGRSMGAGWIRVDASALSSEPELLDWIDSAARHSSARTRPLS